MLKRLTLAALTAAGLARGQTPPPAPERITVSAAGSVTGSAFSYTRVPIEHTPAYTVYDIRYPSPVTTAHPSNNIVPGLLYLPAGMTSTSAFPAVVCLHIIHDNFTLERMVCAQLAQNGVIALFFKQPYYGERNGGLGRALLEQDADTFITGLEQGQQDARRAVDILAALPETNPARIGITGISMGAIQAARVCGEDPRIQKAFLTLVGCDMRSIVMTARETQRVRAFIDGLSEADRARVFACLDRLDPIQAKDALRRLADAGNLRMVCAAEDEVLPPEGGRRLAEAAGFADRVTWLPGLGHYTAMARFPQIMTNVTSFFSADTPASWHPSKIVAEKTPAERVGLFFAGLAAFLNGDPAEGTAHLAGVDAEITVSNTTYRATFDYARGHQGRFRLTGELPTVGKTGLGQSEYPWLISKDRTVLCGNQSFAAERTLDAFLSPKKVLRYRMLAGVLAGAALSPDAMQALYSLKVSDSSAGNQRIDVIFAGEKTSGLLTLTFAKDATPLAAEWAFGASQGKARFSYWRLNAVADNALFEPPADLPHQDAAQETVLRRIAAVVEHPKQKKPPPGAVELR